MSGRSSVKLGRKNGNHKTLFPPVYKTMRCQHKILFVSIKPCLTLKRIVKTWRLKRKPQGSMINDTFLLRNLATFWLIQNQKWIWVKRVNNIQKRVLEYTSVINIQLLYRTCLPVAEAVARIVLVWEVVSKVLYKFIDFILVSTFVDHLFVPFIKRIKPVK